MDPPVWYVTFNAANRERWIACSPVHDAFNRFTFRAREEHQISVGKYVLMPDHVHLFVSGFDLDLGGWVGLLKQMLAKAAPREGQGARRWQEGFFDHLLRSDESYRQKWEYVRDNPVRDGLADRWEDWPFQGEIVPIERP